MKSKKRNSLILLSLLFVIVVGWIVVAPIYKRRFHDHIRAQKKMYCYETYRRVVNRALYAKNEKFIGPLVEYYRNLEAGNLRATFDFPPLEVPYDTSVYVLGYTPDSTAVEIVCYGRFTKSSYIQGFVFINTLHNTPPPDSLVVNK